jgi:hypothetical protein
VERPWEADAGKGFRRRPGKTPQELGVTTDDAGCPDLWELGNGDIAVIGRDLTESLGKNLPAGVPTGADERPVTIPRSMMIAAKPDIPHV